MTDTFHSRAGERQQNPTRPNPQRHEWTLVSIGPSTRSEMHELGNLVVALQCCLRQLGGRQPTDELEQVVRTGLELCDQGVATFRSLHKAVSVPTAAEPSDDLSEQAQRHETRAAEYWAVADQTQDPRARASYRHLAVTYEALGRHLRRERA